MIASLIALDCSVHWFGPLAMLIVGLGFCGMQLGSGSLVSHLDLASRHAAVISGLTGTAGALAYFAIPSLTRLLVAKEGAIVAQMTSRYHTPTMPSVVPVSHFIERPSFCNCGSVTVVL
jgi:nitrate/nitrite transporter NarK